MQTASILKKTYPHLACLALFLLGSIHAGSQVTVFSENFDGSVQPYTASAAYTNANCSNYITFDNTDPSVCGGSFCCSPEITDPSGGNFLFEGTNSGPSYAGPIYQININGTMVAGNTFTISFKVWLADNTNPPQLVPQINGSNAGSSTTPTSTTGWQTLTYTYTPASNITNPVFSIYNGAAAGIGNDFGVDDILITSTVPSAFLLGLDFTSFSATVSADNIALTWETSAGSIADHFIVQQSTDGRHFTDIGEVAAIQSDVANTYAYTTIPSSTGVYYYRITAVEEDGQNLYSSIRAVNIGAQASAFRVLSNLVTNGRLTLGVNSSGTTMAAIRIISTDGKIIIEQDEALHAGTNSLDVDLRDFPPGIYIATLSGNNQAGCAKFLVR